MKYLLFISLVFALDASSLVESRAQSQNECFRSSVPKFSSALYSASIDVVGHHISGLLFLKTMPDSSQRAVFSNEAGITYFDFEWKKNGEFKTYQVIKKLKKRIVVNTLRKDFELIMIPSSVIKSAHTMSGEIGYQAVRKMERMVFNINQDCQSIRSVEVMGKRRKLVEANFLPGGKNIPDSVSIVHYTFNMKIGLKKLEH